MLSQTQKKVMARNKDRFLKAFAECGTIKDASKKTGVLRETHYDWLGRDPEYKRKFELATEDAADRLEAEAIRRAVDGEAKPIYNRQGELVDTVHEKSDTLLIFLMKGWSPARFRERFELPAIPVGGNITTTNVQLNISGLPEDKIRDFLDVSAKLLDRSPAEGSPAPGPAGTRPAESR